MTVVGCWHSSADSADHFDEPVLFQASHAAMSCLTCTSEIVSNELV